jgi:hypothetical protein
MQRRTRARLSVIHVFDADGTCKHSFKLDPRGQLISPPRLQMGNAPQPGAPARQERPFQTLRGPKPDAACSEDSRACEFAGGILAIGEILDAIDYPVPFADEFNQGAIWEDIEPARQWWLTKPPAIPRPLDLD